MSSEGRRTQDGGRGIRLPSFVLHPTNHAPHHCAQPTRSARIGSVGPRTWLTIASDGIMLTPFAAARTKPQPQSAAPAPQPLRSATRCSIHDLVRYSRPAPPMVALAALRQALRSPVSLPARCKAAAMARPCFGASRQPGARPPLLARRYRPPAAAPARQVAW
jgi:hypothetical protein